jgi:hypothetical protein
MFRFRIYAFFLLLLIQAFTVGCRQVTTRKAEEKNSLELEWNRLSQVADSSWVVMMGSDDAKIDNLRRLAKELELIKGSNPAKINQLSTEIDQLPLIRYSRKNMGSGKAIDRYDSATNSILSSIKQEIQSNPETERFQIVQQLRNEIQMADDSVLYFRKGYDKQVDALNGYLKKNRKQLKRISPIFDTIQPFPVFRLQV